MGILIDAVRHAIANATNNKVVNATKLVNLLFTAPNRQFLFVFNQNLRRTNIQFAELLSLLRVHRAYIDPSDPVAETDFTNFDEMKSLITELISRVDLDDRMQRGRFTDLVCQYIANKILVEPYFGTCSVYIPPHVTIDLAKICGESGYIHSCGNLLLLRNAAKLKLREFNSALTSAFALADEAAKFMLVPYCHEDFSAHDRTKSPFLSAGLDDLKLNISKAFIDGQRLSKILADLESENQLRLFIAPGGNYQNSPILFNEWSKGLLPNTIWLITDSDIRKDDRFPGERKFYAMYLQRFRNHNFYQLFDENKPGWGSHTTLPHSLGAAMINVARPWFSKNQPARIADPFGGSGTVYFEAQKVEGISAESIDLSYLNVRIVGDNIAFFSLKKSQLKLIMIELRRCLEAAPVINPLPAALQKRDEAVSRLEKIWGVVAGWTNKVGMDFLELPQSDVDEGFNIIGPTMTDRILLYVSLRARVRGQTEIDRGNEDWLSYFRRELETLMKAIENYLDYLKPAIATVTSALTLTNGTYSPSVMPIPPRTTEESDLFQNLTVRVGDAQNLVANQYDAIICDPPYGFNTDEEFWKFGAVVRNSIRAAIIGLKQTGGQLLVACPQVSFSGRELMPFVRGDFLTRDILRMAAEEGLECFTPNFTATSPFLGIRPPYYWVAEKTLRRSILHFWIRSKSG